MRYVVILFAFIPAVLSASEVPEAVNLIDTWVEEVESMVENGELLTRHVEYTHATIPGIGMPFNKVTAYVYQYEIEEDGDYWMEEVPLLIVNEYFHAGYGARENYFFTIEGEFVCAASVLGLPGEDYTDRFYFIDGDAIYYIDSTGDASGVIDGMLAEKSASRKSQSEFLYELFCGWSIPSPCIFNEISMAAE